MKRGADTYIVICKENGQYILVTREVFPTMEAAEKYRDTCSPSRDALIIPGDFRNLRFPRRKAKKKKKYGTTQPDNLDMNWQG